MQGAKWQPAAPGAAEPLAPANANPFASIKANLAAVAGAEVEDEPAVGFKSSVWSARLPAPPKRGAAGAIDTFKLAGKKLVGCLAYKTVVALDVF